MERVKWGLIIDPSCPICGHDSKDILHIIRDCTAAKTVWRQVIQDTTKIHEGGANWVCLFGLLAWHI
ncbi:hypothetical protein J1N35_015305 [Gossypium stocksii]|uniref:Reverse transcriptase zinc-binding domain-containing protein n=1 Tax=Gossypium stocksii TaxID=47602 RepID=A0A9D3VY80_9ROSI|nr:hypothetical protein J1N35_015305 [Gossypium stocksii]